MSKKKNTYKECCKEIIKICKLAPNWSITEHIEKEQVDITHAPSLFSSLREYREQLELDNKIISDDEETNKILEEGKGIHSVIIKEMMYGSEEQIY